MVRLSTNFSLQEFTKSQTATRKGLDNTPNEEHLVNAKELFANVVQKVRDNFGPTVINSGYRGPALNEAVGGSSNLALSHILVPPRLYSPNHNSSVHETSIESFLNVIGIDRYV